MCLGYFSRQLSQRHHSRVQCLTKRNTGSALRLTVCNHSKVCDLLLSLTNEKPTKIVNQPFDPRVLRPEPCGCSGIPVGAQIELSPLHSHRTTEREIARGEKKRILSMLSRVLLLLGLCAAMASSFPVSHHQRWVQKRALETSTEGYLLPR